MFQKRFIPTLVATFLVLFSHNTLFAQDGVLIDYQATPPARSASAVLELRSSSQGFLAPKVNIASLGTAAPVTSPAEGLIVYNENNTTGKGYYYWDGTQWMRLLNGTSTPPTGNGTLNYITKWTPDGTQLGNSLMFDDGAGIGIGTTAPKGKLEVIGDIWATQASNNDNAIRIRPGMTAGNQYGFADQHNNTMAFVNEQGSTNQAFVLGDVDATGTNTLFGVSVATGGTNPTTGAELAWSKRFEIAGDGTVKLNTYTTNGIVRTTGGTGTLSSTGGAIDLTTEVTGVLPVTNGGSGTGTAFTQGSVIFAGSGGVYAQDNPNLFWNNSTNRLGIGTSASPSDRLHVSSTTHNEIFSIERVEASQGNQFDFRISSNPNSGSGPLNPRSLSIVAEDTPADIAFITDATSNKDPQFVVKSSGNVGISETSPTEKLQIGDGGNFLMDGTGTGLITMGHGIRAANRAELHLHANGENAVSEIFFGHDARTDANVRWTISDRGDTDGRLVFYEGQSLTGTTFVDRITLLSGGNVGIGTSSPDYKLQVAGDVVPETDVTYDLGKPSLRWDNIYVNSIQGPGALWTRTGTNLYNSTLTDNVGIGTATPSTPLEVYKSAGGETTLLKLHKYEGDIGNSSQINIDFEFTDDNTNGTPQARIAALANTDQSAGTGMEAEGTGDLLFYTAAAAGTTTNNLSEKMRITATGNVGIGTTSPSTTFHVSASASNPMTLQTSTTESDINFLNSSGGNWQVGTNNSGNGTASNQFYVYDNAYRLTVQAGTGNVGVNTTSPDVKLDVQVPNYGLPATSGATQTYGGFRISPPSGSGNVVLDMGTNGSVGTWLQSTLRTNLTNTYPLLLNPNGGNIGIGTTTPVAGLHVEAAGNPTLIVRNKTTTGGAAINFSDVTGYTQTGTLEYRHSDTQSFNYGNSFHLSGTETSMIFRVEGDGSYAGNVGIGTTNPTRNLVVESTGDAAIWIDSDSDNAGESDNPYLKISQDGHLVEGILGFVGNNNVDPEGNAYTGMLNNGMLLGTTTAASLQFGTDDNVRVTIENTGDVSVTNLSGTGNRPVYADAGGTLTTGPTAKRGFSISTNLHPSFDDLTTTSLLNSCSDDGTYTWSISGFQFKIDGVVYDDFWISTNGILGFGTSPSTAYSNTSLPASISNDPMVFFHWDDHGSYRIRYAVQGTSPNRICFVFWEGDESTSCGGSDMDIYLSIHEGANTVSVRYRGIQNHTATRGGSATVGFQKAGGSSATEFATLSQNADFLDDNSFNHFFFSVDMEE